MVKEDGSDVTVVTILLHKLGWLTVGFFGLDLLVGLADGKKRCIHNLLSGTVMIEA